MKWLLFFLFVSALGMAKEQPVHGLKIEEPKLRYRHVQDAEGKILATIDGKDGSVEIKDDPKKVVSVLIGFIDNLTAECQKQISDSKKACKLQEVHRHKKLK